MRRLTLASCILVLSTAVLPAATSSVKMKTDDGVRKLPFVSATRFVKIDGAATMYLLFAEKAPTGVVLVNSAGNEDLSLATWTTTAGTTAVKLSFVEGDEENYSVNVHSGANAVAIGGHHSGTDGIRGPFKKLEIKGDTVRGTLQSDEGLSGNFETTFTTVTQPKPITGPAIAASAQGKVLLAYAAAMRKLDFAGASKYSMNDESQGMTPEKMKMLKEIIKHEFGTAAEFEKLLATSSEMVGEGNEYHIRVKRVSGSSSETSSFGLKNVDGQWKVNF
jgi:hypothetical protein